MWRSRGQPGGADSSARSECTAGAGHGFRIQHTGILQPSGTLVQRGRDSDDEYRSPNTRLSRVVFQLPSDPIESRHPHTGSCGRGEAHSTQVVSTVVFRNMRNMGRDRLGKGRC